MSEDAFGDSLPPLPAAHRPLDLRRQALLKMPIGAGLNMARTAPQDGENGQGKTSSSMPPPPLPSASGRGHKVVGWNAYWDACEQVEVSNR